jgi:hypothetical protein
LQKKVTFMPKMYRLDTAGADAKNPYPKLPTRRPPGNVPYLVDNLWEWARPSSFPNRRHSIYASPNPEFARSAGGAINGQVFWVEVRSQDGKVCQIAEPDARFHPDVKKLPKLLNDKLGADWIDGPSHLKQQIAPLWAPCLLAEEVEELFSSTVLAPLRQQISGAISFWQGARLVMEHAQLPYSEGEIFFETQEYHLHPLD